MKRTLFISVILACFSTQLLAQQNTNKAEVKKLAQEVLAGRNVQVRVYNNWQADPRAFKLVPVQLSGLTIDCNDVKTAVGKMGRSAVIVVTAADQTDEAVAAVIGDFVYAELYEKAKSLSIWPASFSDQPDNSWIVTDALGSPIPNAKVEIWLCAAMDKGPRVAVGQVMLDKQGRLKKPNLTGSLKRFYLIVSHPEYGQAIVDQYLYNQTSIVVSLVRIGTEADQRAIWGVVVDPEDNPISGASIECSMVRTLGEGLINSLHGWTYKVLTDEAGRFSSYLPNEKRRDDRGQLIPPKSMYHVRIESPKAFGFLPYVGKITNGRETTIVMERGAYFRRFVFEDANGPITDLNKLKRIHAIVKRRNEAQLSLRYDDWKDGGMFPPGTYHATTSDQTREYEFEPIEVTADSPQELVFKLPEGILYYGQVVHGITGEPIPGAFVISIGGSGRGNFSMITPEQWEELHGLPANPPIDDQTLATVREIYSFSKIVRTDENGHFQMSFGPGQEPYGFVAFEEHYLGLLRRRHALKPDENRLTQVPVMKLFPAAKVMVEPCVDEKRVSICPHWIIDRKNNPAWVSDFLATDDRSESLFIYDQWLKQNQVQSFYVPAGLNLRVRLDAPYDSQWCPIDIAETINLQHGEVLDLGRHIFQPALQVSVKVINTAGKSIEGVPVRMLIRPNHWGVPHNTDENGIARFNVVPHSQGEFGVSYFGEDDLHLKETIPYEIGSQEDVGRQFIIQLSDEMLEHLFK